MDDNSYSMSAVAADGEAAYEAWLCEQQVRAEELLMECPSDITDHDKIDTLVGNLGVSEDDAETILDRIGG